MPCPPRLLLVEEVAGHVLHALQRLLRDARQLRPLGARVLLHLRQEEARLGPPGSPSWEPKIRRNSGVSRRFKPFEALFGLDLGPRPSLAALAPPAGTP